MNQKIYRLCCTCTPQQGIVRMDARTLNQVEKEGKEFINQAHGTRKMAHRALQLGDICQKAGYPYRAIDIWGTTISEIIYRDYKWVLTAKWNRKVIDHVQAQTTNPASQQGVS